jgi:preprotein translocase subunit YajC
MQVHTLEAGDEVLLDGGARVTVLAVEGDTVVLELVVGATTRVVALDAPEQQSACRAALSVSPSQN